MKKFMSIMLIIILIFSLSFLAGCQKKQEEAIEKAPEYPEGKAPAYPEEKAPGYPKEKAPGYPKETPEQK